MVTDNDPELARTEARRLSDMLWASRSKLTLDLPDPATASSCDAKGKFPDGRCSTAGQRGRAVLRANSTFISENCCGRRLKWVVTIADRSGGAGFHARLGQAFDRESEAKTTRCTVSRSVCEGG